MSINNKETPNAITVEGTEFSFHPSEITVMKGEQVTIIFKHVGKIAHNLVIGEFGVRTDTILRGKKDALTFTPTKTGTFPFWCAVPGHRDAGMEGKLIVKE